MKRLANFIIFLLMIFYVQTALANIYVTDKINTALRSAPSPTATVLENLSSGDEIIAKRQETKYWTMVETQSGKIGWIQKKDIITEVPAIVSLKNLQKKYDYLHSIGGNSSEIITKLNNELNKTKAELQTVNASYSRIILYSKDSIEFQKKYELAMLKMNSTDSEIMTLRNENQSLRNDSRLMFGVAGGIIGFIFLVFGLILGKGRRRSRY